MPRNRLERWNGGLDTLVQWPLFLLANKVCRFTSAMWCFFWSARIDTVVSQGFKSLLCTRRIGKDLVFWCRFILRLSLQYNIGGSRMNSGRKWAVMNTWLMPYKRPIKPWNPCCSLYSMRLDIDGEFLSVGVLLSVSSFTSLRTVSVLLYCKIAVRHLLVLAVLLYCWGKSCFYMKQGQWCLWRCERIFGQLQFCGRLQVG